MNENNGNKKILIRIAIVGIVISVAAIIWAGSKIDTKASQAYQFISDNYDLPIHVKNNIAHIEQNERRINKFQDTIGTIIKIQSKQESITERLEEITKNLNRVEGRINNKG